jgi:hypothetical protein
MTAADLTAFKATTASGRHDLFGRSVTFRGTTLSATVGTVSPLAELTDGGVGYDAAFRVRILKAALASEPRRGEQIVISSVVYFIRQLEDLDNPSEYVFTVTNAKP